MKPSPSDIAESIWDMALTYSQLTKKEAEERKEELNLWLNADPRHDQAFKILLRLEHDQALDEALTAYVRPRPSLFKTTFAPLMGTALAACLVLIAVFFAPALIYDVITPSGVFHTVAGEPKTFVLQDGSTLSLNGETSIEAKITPYRRTVRLSRGEAFFDIKHDLKRPFLVKLDTGSVKVLGTKFNLNYGTKGIDLSVYDGKVKLSGDKRHFGLLTKGMSAHLEEGKIKPLPAFDPLGNDWRTGWIEPNDWPLERVALELSRASGTPIIFKSPLLKNRRILGRLRLNDPQSQLESLGDVHGFRVLKDGTTLIIE